METQEDKNVYNKYTQETINKWIKWLSDIPKGADPAENAIMV